MSLGGWRLFLFTTMTFGFLTSEGAGLNSAFTPLAIVLVLSLYIQRRVFGDLYFALDRVYFNRSTNITPFYLRGLNVDPLREEHLEKSFRDYTQTLKVRLWTLGGMALLAVAFFCSKFYVLNFNIHLSTVLALWSAIQVARLATPHHIVYGLGWNAVAVVASSQYLLDRPHYYFVYALLLVANLSMHSGQSLIWSLWKKRGTDDGFKALWARALLHVILLASLGLAINWIVPHRAPMDKLSETMLRKAHSKINNRTSKKKPARPASKSAPNEEQGPSDPGLNVPKTRPQDNGPLRAGLETSSIGTQSISDANIQRPGEQHTESRDPANRISGSAETDTVSEQQIQLEIARLQQQLEKMAEANINDPKSQTSGQNDGSGPDGPRPSDPLGKAGGTENLKKEEIERKLAELQNQLQGRADKMMEKKKVADGPASGRNNEGARPNPKPATSEPEPPELSLEQLKIALKAIKIIALAFGLISLLLFFSRLKRPPKSKEDELREQANQAKKIDLQGEMNRMKQIRLSPREEVLKKYLLFLEYMETLDLGRPDHEPPTSYARHLAILKPKAAIDIEVINTTFCHTFYGNREISAVDLANFDKSLQTVISLVR